ncbi:hypothetical protein BLNAU_5561 [Blattamonas nauphoetae]|uniref:Uncharacterized protein n=1 Tax=Blattamonas nauphoetae TaxID=2049346 RepID=A0ABQ9Y700_9EUKA|nr:hypothetical protein BLNAU_5561 [Blattamonas nauphoetae]
MTEKTPSAVVLNTLAKISLFLDLRIACNSLYSIYWIAVRNSEVLSHIRTPVLPDSPPTSPFYGLSFLKSLSIKMRTVFGQFQKDVRLLLSDIPFLLSLTGVVYYRICRPLFFCVYGWDIFQISSSKRPFEIDVEAGSNIISRAKSAIRFNLDQLQMIHKLADSHPPSDIHSPLFGVEPTETDSAHPFSKENNLDGLKRDLNYMTGSAWNCLSKLASFFAIDLHPHLRSIVIDDLGLEDDILRSIEVGDKDVIIHTFSAVSSFLQITPHIRPRLQSGDFVEKVFSSFDFLSVPLYIPVFHLYTVMFIRGMFEVNEETDEIKQATLQSLRITVYNHVWPYLVYIITHSPTLNLSRQNRVCHEIDVTICHRNVCDMEMKGEELDEGFLLEQAKWEVRWLTEVENEKTTKERILTFEHRASGWMTENKERQKRRERMQRKEGWDDAVEARVTGFNPEMSPDLKGTVFKLGVLASFNPFNS